LARIEYRYEVSGQIHRSTDIGAGDDTSVASLWPEPTDLAPGTEVTVYYNPLAPDRAVLKPGAGFNDWVAFLTPILGLLLVAHLLKLVP